MYNYISLPLQLQLQLLFLFSSRLWNCVKIGCCRVHC